MIFLPVKVYEDAVEMQMFFIKQRDEICKNGEILLTPALSYTEKHLQTALDVEKREKLPKEQREDEEKKKQAEEMDEKQGVQNAVSYKSKTSVHKWIDHWPFFHRKNFYDI